MTDSSKAPSFNLKGPGNFTGNKKDWETWAFRFANYAKNIDFRLGKAFAEIEALGKGTDVDSDWIDDFDLNNPNSAPTAKALTQLDSDLYGYLSEVLTGTAHTHVLKEKTSASGLAVWKRLVQRYGPVIATKVRNLMKEILNFQFRVDHFMDDYDTWENKITEHDSLAKEPAQESVLATCLYSSTSGALREHLDLHPDKCNNWEDLTEVVINYYTAKENAKLESSTATESVNAVWRKGKGKGKGKKGKGKGHFNSTYHSTKGKGNDTGTWGNWNGRDTGFVTNNFLKGMSKGTGM